MKTIHSKTLRGPFQFEESIKIIGPNLNDTKLNVNGAVYLRTHIGQNVSIHADSTQQLYDGHHLGASIDAPGKRVGANSSLYGRNGITIGSCGEGVTLHSKNGIIYVCGTVGPNVHIFNEVGDVFIAGKIQTGTIIEARNIGCIGPVEKGAELSATEEIYINESDLAQSVKTSGIIYSPKGLRKVFTFLGTLGSPVFSAMSGENEFECHVKMKHEEDLPPKGWKLVTRPTEHLKL